MGRLYLNEDASLQGMLRGRAIVKLELRIERSVRGEITLGSVDDHASVGLN